MGFLGGIGKALGGIVKQVAPSIIKAVAPAATGLLKGIVGDAFSFGGAALSKLAGSLPGPLGTIAQKLLGAALPKLQGLAEKGVESLVGKLSDMVLKRLNLPGVGGGVSLPGIADRLPTIAANSPAPAAPSAPATGSNTGAATGAPAAGQSATTTPTGGWGFSGKMPDPRNFDMTDPNKAAEFQAQMAQWQSAMTNMQNFYKALSDSNKSNADIQKSIIGNLR